MKALVLISVILLSFCAFSQDQLVFKDGYNWPCKIVSVENGEITFIRRGNKEEKVLEALLSEYRYGDKWYLISEEGKISSDKSKTGISPSVFLRKSEEQSGKFSLGTNPILPFINVDTDEVPEGYYWYDDDSKAPYFPQTNRTLNLTPEYRFNDFISLGLPLNLGLDFKEPITLEKTATSSYYYGAFANFNSYNVDSNDVSLIRLYRYGERLYGHAKKLLWQVGLSPKYYPFGRTKTAFYLGLSANVGMHDLYQIDYFMDFSYELNPDNWGPEYEFKLKSETAVRNSVKQVYFSGELNIGLELNLARNFSLGLEGVYSSGMLSKGVVDNFYLRNDNDPYVLVWSDRFDISNGRVGYALGRLHLIYRFSSKSEREGSNE